MLELAAELGTQQSRRPGLDYDYYYHCVQTLGQSVSFETTL